MKRTYLFFMLCAQSWIDPLYAQELQTTIADLPDQIDLTTTRADGTFDNLTVNNIAHFEGPVIFDGSIDLGTTNRAVQVGTSTGGLRSIPVGTNGQLLVGSTGADPKFATLGTSNGITKTTGAGTLSIAGVNATTAVTGVVQLATSAETIAGTNTTDAVTPAGLNAKLGTQTQFGVLFGGGTSGAVGATSVGLAGQVLTSNGAGMAPTFQPGGGGSGITTLNGDTGSATGATVTIAGGSNIGTTAGGSTVTVNLDNSPSVSGSVTAGTGFVATTGGFTDATFASNRVVISGAPFATTAAGTAGQVLQSAGAAAPTYSTTTYPSTSAQGDIIYASAANTLVTLAKSTTATRYLANTGTSNNPQWDQVNLTNGVTGVLPIANGGTNASSFATTDGTVYFDGTRLVTTATGTANQVLTSNGAGVAPTYQDVSASGAVTSVPTDSGTATPSGGALTIAGGSNINTSGAGSTVTVNLDNSPSVSGSVTAGTGLIATTGGLTVSAGGADITGTTTIQSGTGGISMTSTGAGDITLNSGDTLLLDSAGVLELNSSGAAISIGNDAVAQAINIGTGAAARTITVGNTTGGTAVNIDCGTGGANFGTTSNAHATTIGTTTGGATTVINAPLGGVTVNGVFGNTTGATGILMFVDDAGELGTLVSSERFKENIRDIAAKSGVIHKLRPVMFNLKKDAKKTLQFGLLAEQVFEQFPELVVMDEDGQPLTVKYHELLPLLLNELQKQQVRIEEQQRFIIDLVARIQAVEARISQ